MQKDKNNLFITLLLYCITLWSNGCIGCISNLFSKNLSPKQGLKTLQPLANDFKELNSAKDPVVPAVLPEHCGDLPSTACPVAPTTDYPAAVNTANTSLTPTCEASTQPDIVSGHSVNTSDMPLKPTLDQVPILPDIVSSHTNRGEDSQIAKPREVVSVETDLNGAWKIVQATVGSFYRAQKGFQV